LKMPGFISGNPLKKEWISFIHPYSTTFQDPIINEF
jgi:hypothetical protein